MNSKLSSLKSNEIADALSTQGWWLSTDFVPLSVCESLIRAAKAQAEMNRFKEAGIGKGVRKKVVKNIRKDEIFWIEDWNAPTFKDYKVLLEILIESLRRELFLPIKRFEGHLAHYKANAFYLRHSDRHSVQPHRLITSVLYLNDVPEDKGGELVLYKEESVLTVIQPRKGKLVLFDSAIPHEVKPTKTSRWSVTCWMRDDVL